MTLTFRTATGADTEAIAAVVERAYRGPAAARSWTNESTLLSGPRSSPEQVAARIADAGSRFVLAELDGRLVGCALVEDHGADAYFGMFAVDPDRQAGGVGKALLAECERVAVEQWSARRMTLNVISLRDDLIAWYGRRGFARTGAREPFPFEHAPGALRTDFDLVQLAKDLA